MLAAALVGGGLLATAAVRLGTVSALALPAVLFLPLLLPWLPAAWLVVGPGGTAVWAVTAVGLARRRGLPRALRVPALATALAGVVATIWMGGLARSVGANAMTGDAPHYLVIAQSLLADGDWDVGNQYDDESYRAFFNTRLTRPHVTTGPQGQRYSMHAPGTALLVLPGFAGFGPAGATATLVLLLAAASALFWRVVWRHTGQAEAAWFAWAALVASAPYALHAATIFPDGPAAAAAIVGLWLLVALAGGRGVSLGTLALCSAPLAALPWLHVRFAMVAGLLGAGVITLLIRERVDRAVRADRVAWWLMIPAISFALWLAVTFVMSGTMDPTSTMRSQYAPSPLMSVPFGLAGLLVDREFGLLQAAPVMLAAGAGWFALRAQPVLAWTTGAVVVGTFALTSAWGWAGGRAAPGRLVTVVVPVLAFWLGLAWAHGGRAMRQLLLLALVATATWTWHAATLDDGLRAYQSADGRLSVAEGLSTSVDLASALPSMFRDDAEPQTESAVAVLWILALLAGAGAVWAAHRRWSEPAAWLAGGVIAMATVAAAASAVWWVRDINPWTPRQAGLELARGASALPGAWPVAGWPMRVSAPVPPGLTLGTPEWLLSPPAVALYVPVIPPGVYQVREAAGAADGGAVRRLELGREAWPLATWTTTAGAPRFTLAVPLHSVRVVHRGAGGPRTWLDVLEILPGVHASVARRVTRYGDLLVYSMDDASHVEPDGLWTGGDRAAELLLASASGRPVEAVVDYVAGPAAVTVAITGTAAATPRALAPHERRSVIVAVASDRRPTRLLVTVGGGFRAHERGGPATDDRWLGVRLSFPQR